MHGAHPPPTHAQPVTHDPHTHEHSRKTKQPQIDTYCQNFTILCCMLLCLLQDVKLTATNDDHYFVFEDFLYQVSKLLGGLFSNIPFCASRCL